MSLQAGRYAVTSTSAPCAMPACQVTLTLMLASHLYAGYLMIRFSTTIEEDKMEEFKRWHKEAAVPLDSGGA